MRYGNYALKVSCSGGQNVSLPVPGFYTVKAYAVQSNGSISPYPVFNGSTQLTSQGTISS